MIQKPRLFTPGPTPLHPAVQEAMARPIPHHRTDEFRKVFAESITGLKAFLKTSEDVLILAGSGTGGMEAAPANFGHSRGWGSSAIRCGRSTASFAGSRTSLRPAHSS